jgi:hypothetical protein
MLPIDLEYLLYEITYDKLFHIENNNPINYNPNNMSIQPMSIIEPLSIENMNEIGNIMNIIAFNPTTGTNILKKQMLRVLGDRLICSLKTSPVNDINEVCI